MISRRRREIDCSCSQASGPMPLRIRAIVEYDGAGTDGPALVVPLDTAQRLLGQPGRIEHILVSNTGDAERGVTRSDEVIRLLEPTLTPLGLEADPEKEDLLAQADEEGGRLHLALHDLRQLLDRRRHPPDLPDLRHARRGAARRAGNCASSWHAPEPPRADIPLRRRRVRRRGGRGRHPAGGRRCLRHGVRDGAGAPGVRRGAAVRRDCARAWCSPTRSAFCSR